MGSKFKKESGQPEITALLNLSEEEEIRSYQKEEESVRSTPVQSNNSRKKRSPPSLEKAPVKRTCHKEEAKMVKSGNEEIKGSTKDKERLVPVVTNDIEMSGEDTSDDEDESLTKEQLAFEKRLTKSLSKLMKKELRTVKSDLKSLSASQKSTELRITEFATIKEENVRLRAECEKVLQENKHLKKRITNIENSLLDNNIILHGIHEDAWELDSNRMEKVINVISYTIDEETEEEQLEVARKIRIKSTKRMGMYSSKRSRPISITFERYCDAEYVLVNRRHLPRGIFADKEYNEETENNRRLLRPIYRAAKKSPSYAGKCRLDGDTLIIKGLSYTVDDLHRLPEDLNGFHVTSKTDEEKICFFGELNPLSNFHQCKFVVDGIQFHSAEQFIQYHKARFFKDIDISEQILHTASSLQCKQLSRQIGNYNQQKWISNARKICEPGIKAKFVQNATLNRLLHSTGSKTLAEASYDLVWGTGVPLHSDDCLKKEKWESIGILGEILMHIRETEYGIISNNDQLSSSKDTISNNTG